MFSFQYAVRLTYCCQIDLHEFNDDESRSLSHLVQSAQDRRGVSKWSHGLHLPSNDAKDRRRSLAKEFRGILAKEPEFNTNGVLQIEHAQFNLGTLPQNLPYYHPHKINPFHFQSDETARALMHVFVERVNHTFYFFDEQELLQNLGMAYSESVEHSNRIVSEMCLALAVGSQWSDYGNDDNSTFWYENGRRYLDDTHWDHQPWVMRVMALISMYHLGKRPDNAQHYLGEYTFSNLKV